MRQRVSCSWSPRDKLALQNSVVRRAAGVRSSSTASPRVSAVHANGSLLFACACRPARCCRSAAALPPLQHGGELCVIRLWTFGNVDMCKARDNCVSLKKPGMKEVHALQEPSDSPAVHSACRRATLRVHCCRCFGRPSVGGGHAADRGHALVLGRASLLLLPLGCLPLLHLPNVLCSWVSRERCVSGSGQPAGVLAVL